MGVDFGEAFLSSDMLVDMVWVGVHLLLVLCLTLNPSLSCD